MSTKNDHIAQQYLNSQFDYNQIKQGNYDWDLSKVKTVNTAADEAKKDFEKLKSRLKVLDGINSISKAKEVITESV